MPLVPIVLKPLAPLVWDSTWRDFDNPSGDGDFEYYGQWENTNCDVIFDVIAQDLATGIEYTSGDDAPNRFEYFTINGGVACRNSEQIDGVGCADYAVKRLCPDY